MHSDWTKNNYPDSYLDQSECINYNDTYLTPLEMTENVHKLGSVMHDCKKTHSVYLGKELSG